MFLTPPPSGDIWDKDLSSDLTSKTAYLYAGSVTNDQLTFSNAGTGIKLKIPGHVALCYCALVTGVGEEMKCRLVLFVLLSSGSC